MSLSNQHCVPCRGGVSPLDRAEAERYLQEVPEWTLSENRIRRRFAFKNFTAAQSFVNRIAGLAEEEGHHPDICFGWGYCEVTLYSHKINGLHQNDFIMAAKIEERYGD